jgi:hypothetical protein
MRIFIAALAMLAASAAWAQELTVGQGDSTQTVLAASKGKRVVVRTRSGQELTGTVREVNAKVVVLGALGGREFFDAAVSLDAVEAVLVRNKQ